MGKVKVFSMNKFISSRIKEGISPEYRPSWAFQCEGKEVIDRRVLGTGFVSEDKWTAKIDEKYVRR